jgi:hypothetical protein
VALDALQVPRFGRTGIGDGAGVASTAPAGSDSEITSAGITKTLEIANFRGFINLKINRKPSITSLAHRISQNID